MFLFLLLFWPSLSLGCHNSVLNRSLMYFVKFSDALHEKCRNLRTTDYADSTDGFIQKDGAHETHERNERKSYQSLKFPRLFACFVGRTVFNFFVVFCGKKNVSAACPNQVVAATASQGFASIRVLRGQKKSGTAAPHSKRFVLFV